MNTESHIEDCLRQARPRLNTMLVLMFSEARLFGQKSQWLASAITLMEPLGFQERATRTALFRLTEHQAIRVERHGRRSLCMLTPATAAAVRAARQRLDIPPARSFAEDWTILVNSGGISAARYTAARKRLLALDYCPLAHNLLARPASYCAGIEGASASEDHGLAAFDVSGAQLAAAMRQPLFGRSEWDLDAADALYREFQQRFQPLRKLLDQHGAISDAQAFAIRLLVSHGYQHCRRADPLLPQELLPASWPAMAAYQTYVALYCRCAGQARRHIQTVTAATAAPSPAPGIARIRRPLLTSDHVLTA
ncbi:transcriptional regulator, PaaX family protein [Rugamonas sp. A1-17]|nr:transcriptional regulator, PaaX family protein [Rugamonas sp. A1-17]